MEAGVGVLNFPISNSPVLTVKNSNPLVFEVRGDVNIAGSNLYAVNSVHSFNVVGSSVIGSWQYLNSSENVTATGNATGPSLNVFPYYSTAIATGAGNSNNTNANLRAYSQLFDKIGTLTIGADSIETGSVTADSVTIRFTGDGLYNENNPTKIGSFPVNLLAANGSVLSTQQCVPVLTDLGNYPNGLWKGIGTCSITFPLNITKSAGSSITYTLETPDPVIQKAGGGQNGDYHNVKLYLDDMIWSDGTNAGIHWNSSSQPIQVFNYTYQ